MTYPIITLIVESLQRVFGGSLFLPLIIIGIISILLLSIKGGRILFFIVILPLITTVVLFGRFEGTTVDMRWLIVTGWMALGVIVTGIFWKIIQ